MFLSDFSEEELLHLIALQQIPGVGAHRMRTLLSSFTEAVQVFDQDMDRLANLPSFSHELAQRILTEKNLSEAQRALDWIRTQGIRMYGIHDALYPDWLRKCPDAPYIIYVWGNDSVWSRLNAMPLVSVVGTRRATTYGMAQTREIISNLSEIQPETGIVSGMALGIDGCAHETALNRNMVTLAVLAYGFQHIYPKEHTAMAAVIKERGALISEYLPSVSPSRMSFPARNRLIAGLSQATLIMETKIKGGAVITAELARAYDREVFAVPGDRNREESRGCHALIANHIAQIYVDTDTFLQTMQWHRKEKIISEKIKGKPTNQLTNQPVSLTRSALQNAPPRAPIECYAAPPKDLSALQTKVYLHIKQYPKLHIDTLTEMLHLPLATLAPILLELEMMDYIESEAGTGYSCKR